MDIREQRQVAALLDKAQVAVLVVSRANGRVLYVNQVVYNDLDRAPAKVLARHYRQVFSPEFCRLYEKLLAECTGLNACTDVFYWQERQVWEQISAKRILWMGNEPAMMLNITNITEVGRTLYTYERLAYMDNLLEIPNGAKLEKDITALTDLERVGFIYLEIDHFDSINDLRGFDVGDAVLAQVRDWLMESETLDAQVYRLPKGFAILGKNVSTADAERRAVDILQRFKAPWNIVRADAAPLSLYLHASVGIVSGKYVHKEMRNRLMRTSKAPKNAQGFSVYNEKVDEEAERLLKMQQTLNNCVLRGMEGFYVCFQPIVERETHRWVGAEALCRLRTPSGQEIPPLVFIRLAEQMGLIGQIDNWVRETAVTQCLKWGLHARTFSLDVNFSPMQAIDQAFIDELMELLRKANSPALWLILEVTESARMPFNEENVRNLGRLREEGILLSLDDFGTGYSSFENLIKIPGTHLKTEKLFLDNIENDSYRQYLMKILVDVGHHLGMQIVSEGVETREQAALLESLGADYMQGYLFSRPLPADQFEKELWRYGRRPAI